MNKIIALFIIIIAILAAPAVYAQSESECHVIDGKVLCPPQKPQGCAIFNGQQLCESPMSPAELEQREKAAQEAKAAQFRAWCTGTAGNLDVSGTVCHHQPPQPVWYGYGHGGISTYSSYGRQGNLGVSISIGSPYGGWFRPAW